MKTRLRLFDGRKVVVEQTLTAITAQFEGEPDAKKITSDEYMKLVCLGVPCGVII